MSPKGKQKYRDPDEQKERHGQVSSAAKALYEEMDKLTKKGPTMEVSLLSLDRVNKMIRTVKELVAEDKDEFVDDIVEFVPAGDLPEYRDVALVLSQLNAGLERFCRKRSRDWNMRQY